MRRHVIALTTAAVVLAFAPRLASADVPLSVILNGKPVALHGTGALEHRGKTYMVAAQAVRTFDGLMSFGRDGWVRIGIGGRTMAFSAGRSYGLLGGKRVALSAPPFTLNGDLYVPLSALAKLAGDSLVVDEKAGTVTLTSGAVPVTTPQAAATQPATTSGDEPSPLQALKLIATATSDATALHAHLTITNTLGQRYKLNFPTAKQFALVLDENGNEVWNSSDDTPAGKASTWTIDAHGTQTIDADWAGFNKLPPGRFLLRVRLMTNPALDTSPVSLDVSPAAH